MDAQESRDAHEIITERHRAGSMIVSSNRGPDEWLATFADPMRAQAAIGRFTSNAYDLVIEGESFSGPAQAWPEGWTEGGEEGQVDDVTPMRSQGGNPSATAGSHPSVNQHATDFLVSAPRE